MKTFLFQIRKVIFARNKFFSIVLMFIWAVLISLLILDSRDPSKLSILETLQESSFVRGMFLDIGVFSTLASVWILYSSDKITRYFFAFFVLFIGSFALLPYISLLLWDYKK